MIYFAKADPRLIMPKRRRFFGWTINFGRRHAMPVLLGTVLVPSVLVTLRTNARP